MTDRPLGVFCAYALARAFWTTTPEAFTNAWLIVGASTLLTIMRSWDEYDWQWLRLGLGCVAVFEFILGVLQFKKLGLVFGTFSSSNFYGDFFAILSALMPLVLVPFFAVAIGLSGSILAALAFFIATWMRLGRHISMYWFWGFAALAFGFFRHDYAPIFATISARLDWWKESLVLFSQAPIFGHGFGSWMVMTNTAATHNELLQLLAEGGLVGVGLLGWWLWDQGRTLWTPAVVAFGITAMGVQSVRTVGVLLVGLIAIVHFRAGYLPNTPTNTRLVAQ